DYESVRIIELSQIITELIEVVYNRKVDRSSFNYSRFMMHLKYFSSRVLCNEKIKQKDIGDIYEQFLEKDILLQRAIHEIERYLYATFKYELILEEKLYLSIRTKVLMD
ncbi:TPA: hypothetical protein RPD23_003299, partial [Escherichia coli]|nr:hypothetical protein [Escherichia coli]HDY2830427.1 hypothetical protein [Escherichia coli]